MRNEAISIREYKPSDKAAVVEITQRAWANVTLWKMIEDQYGMRGKKPWWRHKLEPILKFSETNPNQFFVAELEGKVVGYAMYSINTETKIGVVLDNAVSPDFSGQGIGGILHRKVLNAMKDSGMEIAKVTTGTDDSFAPARKLYERHGFKEVQRHIDYLCPLSD